MLDQANKYEDEIKLINNDKKRALDDAEKELDKNKQQRDIEVQQITDSKNQCKYAFEKKSNECLELSEHLIANAAIIADLELTIRSLSESIKIANEAKKAEIQQIHYFHHSQMEETVKEYNILQEAFKKLASLQPG